MKSALIGYTGFVGSNLDLQYNFDCKYNSKNISDIDNNFFDLVVCAGVKAVKWYANQHSEEDLQGIENLITHLKAIQSKKFVLISTIDVYPFPNGAYEDTEQDFLNNHPYGKNRFYLENFVKDKFEDYLIIRLPGLFGKNIKKNVIFDLLNNKQTEKIIPNASFQYYYLDNLWKDIQICMNNNLKVVNFSTEPLETQEIIDKFFPESKVGESVDSPVRYDFKTRYDKIFHGENGYIYGKNEIINNLSDFIKNY